MSEHKHIILIGGRPLKYRIRRNRRSRRVRVNVSPREGVVVVIPWRVALKEVPAILEEFGPWLQEKADQCRCWQGPEVKQYASGSRVFVLGHPRTLELRALPAGRSRPRISLEDDRLVMVLPPGDIWDPRPALEKWLRALARQELNERVDHWSDRTGLYPDRVIVGDRRTRWGSCSSQGTLSFCYRLIMALPEVLDSVVIHELCHLRHLDHGPRFYALFGRHCPLHEEASAWLRRHHEDLQL